MTFRRFLAAILLMLVPLAGLAQGTGAIFRDLESKLRLDRAQKPLFDDAVAATQRAMLATGLVALQLKGRFDEELRKPRPDLGRMLGDPDDLLDQVRPQWREAHEAWSRLYATLDRRQLAIARDEVERRLGMLEGATAGVLKGFEDRLNR